MHIQVQIHSIARFGAGTSEADTDRYHFLWINKTSGADYQDEPRYKYPPVV